MASRIKRTMLSPMYLLPDRAVDFATGLWLSGLTKEIFGEVTDKFLELLLSGMDWAFALSKGYRKNIEGFEGKYLFRTADNIVATSVVFKGSNMDVYDNAIDDWDARVTFKNAKALWSFLFSQNQDILNSILANEVEVDGNLNYIYKFGFMARDLAKRLGMGNLKRRG
ncbi:MAG: hypothetical protein HZB80_10010 [Deltaproteobacteria bacterium]|nr:hypothetical protein [Deltaproteobacteria bacterium]